MRYTQKETKMLTDCHRELGAIVARDRNRYGRHQDNENECIDCGQPIDEQYELCTRCWHDREREKQERNPLDDLPDNLDDYCDDCGHAPGRCNCGQPLDLLRGKIFSLKSTAAGFQADPDYLHLAARLWWEGYCNGADIELEQQQAGYRLISEENF